MASAKAATGSGGEGSDMFTRMANEILDSAEKLSTRLEEGLNAIFTGDIAASASKQQASPLGGGNGMLQQEAKKFMTEEMAGDEDFDWSNVDLDADSPLSGIAESVMGDIMSAQSGPQTFRENFDAFRSAITWSEPFILGLMVFQLFMFLSTIYVSRRNVSLLPRVILMLCIAGIVRSAEWLNKWAGNNWEPYCTQNYFDARGIFISIFLCVPLLFNSFIMLICFLRESSLLLVQVKRAEIKQKRKKAKASSGADPNTKRRGKKDQ